MKQSLKCPKCRESRIWILDPFRLPGETAEGKTLSVVPHQGPSGYFGFGTMLPCGSFSMYVCAGCGYSELYASDFANLTEDPGRGVRLIDATAQKQGPFR